MAQLLAPNPTSLPKSPCQEHSESVVVFFVGPKFTRLDSGEQWAVRQCTITTNAKINGFYKKKWNDPRRSSGATTPAADLNNTRFPKLHLFLDISPLCALTSSLVLPLVISLLWGSLDLLFKAKTAACCANCKTAFLAIFWLLLLVFWLMDSESDDTEVDFWWWLFETEACFLFLW